jgi:surfactin synthase thioesterase subunit
MRTEKLICIPYAGGSAAIFNKWKKKLPSKIEVLPIELAGRGTRIDEPPYESFQQALDDMHDKLNSMELDQYSIFGHSMGAIISFALLSNLRNTGKNLPNHVFLSGMQPPNSEKNLRKKYHELSDQKFKNKIWELGGTPKEFFQEPELLEIFLPLLRSDFKIASQDLSNYSIKNLKTKIHVFNGEQEIEKENLEMWKVFSKNISISIFQGGHFFINEYTTEVLDRINEIILRP